MGFDFSGFQILIRFGCFPVVFAQFYGLVIIARCIGIVRPAPGSASHNRCHQDKTRHILMHAFFLFSFSFS